MKKDKSRTGHPKRKNSHSIQPSLHQTFSNNNSYQSQEASNTVLLNCILVHDSNIVHRDIKPQNILLDADLNIKIIDFGRAVKLVNSEQRLKGSEGTYHFMAP